MLYDRPAIAGIIVILLLAVGVIGLFLIAQHGRESFVDRSSEVLAVQTDTSDDTTDVGDTLSATTYDRSESDNHSSNGDHSAAPLVVGSVTMQGAVVQCVAGRTDFSVTGMKLSANQHHKASSFTWRVDILSTMDLSTGDQWRGNIPAGETDYVVTYEFSEARTLYSRSFTHPHDEMMIRLRVTRPNDVASQWFTIPASDSCE